MNFNKMVGPVFLAGTLTFYGCGDTKPDRRDDSISTEIIGTIVFRGLSLQLEGGDNITLPFTDGTLTFEECTNAAGKPINGKDITVIDEPDFGLAAIKSSLSEMSDLNNSSVPVKTTMTVKGEDVTCNAVRIELPSVVKVMPENLCGDAGTLPALMSDCDNNTDTDGNPSDSKMLTAAPDKLEKGSLAAFIGSVSKKSLELFSDDNGFKDNKETIVYQFSTAMLADAN